MRLALLSSGDGWHVRDLQRAATALGHEAVAVDFRRVHAVVGSGSGPLDHFDAILVRTASVLYVQQFIQHPGWDLRVFVVGGRVLTAMRRRARGDWRTNVAQGGVGEVVTLDADAEQLALQAAAVAGVPLAGVDLLPG